MINLVLFVQYSCGGIFIPEDTMTKSNITMMKKQVMMSFMMSDPGFWNGPNNLFKLTPVS